MFPEGNGNILVCVESAQILPSARSVKRSLSPNRRRYHRFMRAFLWCGALLVTASCFVDDVSESTAGTGAPTSNGGAATSGGAGGEGPGPGPGPGAGGSGGGSVGGSGGSGAGSGAGGSGGAAGAGGSGGAGGAGGCTNHYLSFDDDYAYIAYDQSFDYSNDFSFGGRVRLGADPKFALQVHH